MPRLTVYGISVGSGKEGTAVREVDCGGGSLQPGSFEGESRGRECSPEPESDITLRAHSSDLPPAGSQPQGPDRLPEQHHQPGDQRSAIAVGDISYLDHISICISTFPRGEVGPHGSLFQPWL